MKNLALLEPILDPEAKRQLDILLEQKKTRAGAWPPEERLPALDAWIASTRELANEFSKNLRIAETDYVPPDFRELNRIFLSLADEVDFGKISENLI